MRRIIKAILILFLLISNATSLRVLWIGNSYTYYNDLPSMVARLAEADDVVVQFDSHTEGGWTWEQHSQSQETLDKIYSQQWDVVVLQEFSTRLAYDDLSVCEHSKPYLDILLEQILANNPETRIQFYLTWGRPHGENHLCKEQEQFCAYETMQVGFD